MKSNMRNLIPAFVVVVVFAGIIISVLPYPMAAKRLPIAASLAAILLSCISIAREIMPGTAQVHDEQAGSGDGARKKHDIPGNVLLVSTGWILAILVFIGLLGFTAGFSLYVFIYYRLHGGTWMGSVIIGLGVAAFVYFVFVVALDFLLPKGILFPLIGM